MSGNIRCFSRHVDCPDCFPTSEQAEILALSNIGKEYIEFIVCFDELSKSFLDEYIKKYSKKKIEVYINSDLFPQAIVDYEEYFDVYMSPKKNQEVTFDF